jgi:hypothetical protein
VIEVSEKEDTQISSTPKKKTFGTRKITTPKNPKSGISKKKHQLQENLQLLQLKETVKMKYWDQAINGRIVMWTY